MLEIDLNKHQTRNKMRSREAAQRLEEFAIHFPGVDLKADRFVISGPMFTTGGASPSFDFDLVLDAIELQSGSRLYDSTDNGVWVTVDVQNGDWTGAGLVQLTGLVGGQLPRPGSAARVRRPLWWCLAVATAEFSIGGQKWV